MKCPRCASAWRDALDDITGMATSTARWPGGPNLSERAVFLKELGRAEVRIRAARLAHREAVQVVWATAQQGNVPDNAQQLALTTASVYAVETCADVISDLFRYGGGRVLSLSSPMQRHLRNALAARQHIAVSEEFYEAAGRLRIESASCPQDVDGPGDHQRADGEGNGRLDEHGQLRPPGQRHHVGRTERGGVGIRQVEVVDELRLPVRRRQVRVRHLREHQVRMRDDAVRPAHRAAAVELPVPE